MKKISVKGQEIKITGYIILTISIIIIFKSIQFIFSIGGNFHVPINIFAVTNSNFPGEFYQLLNFIVWLGIIFFVFSCGLKILRTAIKIFHLDLNLKSIKKQDLDELQSIIENHIKMSE